MKGSPMHDSVLLLWRPLIKEAVRILSPDFDYLSVLASDTAGKMYQVRTRSSDMRDFMCERGIVARAIQDGVVVEVSLNDLPATGKLLARKLGSLLNAQFQWISENHVETLDVHLKDETKIEDFIVLAQIPFTSISTQDKLARLRKLVTDVAAKDERILNAVSVLGEVTVNKLFISKHKDLYQSYPWSQGYLMAIAKGDKGVKMGFTSVAGQKGAEILDELETKTDTLVKQVDDILNAKAMVPGEYDVICTPEITG
ncbi:MAG: hypothetical protein E4G74_01680, partial [Erysipelotrichales bacterium]